MRASIVIALVVGCSEPGSSSTPVDEPDPPTVPVEEEEEEEEEVEEPMEPPPGTPGALIANLSPDEVTLTVSLNPAVDCALLAAPSLAGSMEVGTESQIVLGPGETLQAAAPDPDMRCSVLRVVSAALPVVRSAVIDGDLPGQDLADPDSWTHNAIVIDDYGLPTVVGASTEEAPASCPSRPFEWDWWTPSGDYLVIGVDTTDDPSHGRCSGLTLIDQFSDYDMSLCGVDFELSFSVGDYVHVEESLDRLLVEGLNRPDRVEVLVGQPLPDWLELTTTHDPNDEALGLRDDACLVQTECAAALAADAVITTTSGDQVVAWGETVTVAGPDGDVAFTLGQLGAPLDPACALEGSYVLVE